MDRQHLTALSAVRSVLIAVCLAMVPGSRSAAADVDLIDTLLRGIAHRRTVVDSINMVLLVDTVASEPLVADHEGWLKTMYAQCNGGAIPNVERRDVACVRVAHDREVCVWQLACLNDSGWDWWDLGDRWGLRTRSFRRPLEKDLWLAGVSDGTGVYTYDATRSTCTIASPSAQLVPPLPRRFLDLVLDGGWCDASMQMFREEMACRVIGKSEVNGYTCLVIGGVGQKAPPRGMRRVWVAPELGYAIVRMEQIEVAQGGQPTDCVVYSASDFRRDGQQPCLPHCVHEDVFGRTGDTGAWGWLWSRETRALRLDTHVALALQPSDYIFPIGQRWRDMDTGAIVWDPPSVARDALDAPYPEPDRLGGMIPAHAVDLDELLVHVFADQVGDPGATRPH